MFALFKSLAAVENFGGRWNRQLQCLGWAESLVLVSSRGGSAELVYLLLNFTYAFDICQHICASQE